MLGSTFGPFPHDWHAQCLVTHHGAFGVEAAQAEPVVAVAVAGLVVAFGRAFPAWLVVLCLPKLVSVGVEAAQAEPVVAVAVRLAL